MIKNLRKLRMSKGMSQQQLADVIGTSQQSINQYENHNVEPDIATLIRIADYFQITLDHLVGHEGSVSENAEDMEFNRDEMNLVLNYRQLSKEEKESIRLIQKNYLKNR